MAKKKVPRVEEIGKSNFIFTDDILSIPKEKLKGASLKIYNMDPRWHPHFKWLYENFDRLGIKELEVHSGPDDKHSDCGVYLDHGLPADLDADEVMTMLALKAFEYHTGIRYEDFLAAFDWYDEPELFGEAMRGFANTIQRILEEQGEEEDRKALDERSFYVHPERYPKLDNYDAVEVSRLKNLPFDCPCVMAVPITVLENFPDWLELVGISKKDQASPIAKHVDGVTYNPVLNGKELFNRIFVRNKYLAYADYETAMRQIEYIKDNPDFDDYED